MQLFSTALRLIVAALLLSCSIGHAATYYVRTDGHNTSCNGTADASSASAPNCAFLTIQKGVDTAQAGDIVSIRAGSYSGFQSARSGSSGSYITVTNRASDVVTLSSSYPAGQVRIEHNYISINGITFTMSDSYEGGASLRVGYSAQRNHVNVTNCKFSANGANTFLATLYADDVLFDSNLIEGPQFFIGLVQSGARQVVSNNVIRNITDVERVFNVAASDSSYLNNEIYNIAWSGDGSVHPDIWQTISDGSTSKNVLIEGNYVHDFSNAQVGNTEMTGSNVSDWTWRNNVFANAGTLYIHTANQKFYNNTYYRTGASGQSAILMYCDGLGCGNGAEFKNNIFIQDSNQGCFAISGGSPTYTYDYNMSALSGTYGTKSCTVGAHGITSGNPRFAVVSNNCISTACDFHIGATSVAIGAGTVLSGYTTDKAGATRSIPWDLGAYEYNAGLLSAPTNLRWMIK